MKEHEELITQLETKYKKIIEEEGHQEIADGFGQAMDIVKEWKNGLVVIYMMEG